MANYFTNTIKEQNKIRRSAILVDGTAAQKKCTSLFLQQLRMISLHLKDKLPEQGVRPGKPFSRKLRGVILVEGFVHEARTSVSGDQHVYAMPDFLFIYTGNAS